jgi:hypothetical protein
MSANNWNICPRCGLSEEAFRANTEKSLAEAYGKIEAKAYLELAGSCNKQMAEYEPPYNFREDYGIGTDSDGIFYVSYRGGCSECGLVHSFKHEEKIQMDQKSVAPAKAKKGKR